MTFVSYAQNFEDVMLWRALRDVENGFYIDVGAAHPDIDSVTRAFYDHGWTGINLEPVPELHKRLCAARQHDINLCAVAGQQATGSIVHVIAGTGLSTSDGALALQHQQAGYDVRAQRTEVLPLAEICRRHAPHTIHFLKIDAEGDERAVLSGADFAAYRPWIVLVEATAPGTRVPTHDAWEPILLESGYRFLWFDGLNRFYAAAEHAPDIAPHFTIPPCVFDDFVRAIDTEMTRRLTTAEIRATELLQRSMAAETAAARAHAAARSAETRAHDAEIRAHNAETRAQQAEPRALGAERRSDEAERRLAQTEEDLATRTAEVRHLLAALQHARQDAALLRASTSWRITTPLRGAFNLARQLVAARQTRLPVIGSIAPPARMPAAVDAARALRAPEPPPRAPAAPYSPPPADARPEQALPFTTPPAPLVAAIGSAPREQRPRTTRTIHQFHSGSAVNDAITNAMLLIRRELRTLGYRSDIFVEFLDPALSTELRLIDELPSGDDYVLLLHHSMGYDRFDRILALPSRKVLIYHNITPAALFDGAPEVQHYLRLGREQLARLRGHVAAALADSDYNALELRALGFDDPQACTLLFDLAALRRRSSSRLRAADAPFTILFVGRIAANKSQLDLLEAFALFQARHDHAARLVLVGRDDGLGAGYALALREGIEVLGLQGAVILTGLISDEDRDRWYRAADLYVSLSRHEGFGVPLVEAMAQGLPVLAWPAGAVAYTLGSEAGILRSRRAEDVAARLAELAADPQALAALADAQQQSLGRFELAAQLPTLVRALARAGAAAPADPALRRLLAANLRFTIAGHVNGSYSLAAINRTLARALEQARPGDVRLNPVEGEPTAEIGRVPDAERDAIAMLVSRPPHETGPAVVISQHYPVYVPPDHGDLLLAYLFWEESLLPPETVVCLNAGFRGVLAPSHDVARALHNSGVALPVVTVGFAPELEPFSRLAGAAARAGDTTVFLHVSSAFPRKGIDALLAAYTQAFRRQDRVRLVIKTFPNPHNTVQAALEALARLDPDAPDILLIDQDLDEAAMLRLYEEADAMVLPTRGEGFNIPAAEAMAAGLPLIVTGFGGHMDFCNQDTARLVRYTLAPSRSHLATPLSFWAEPDIGDLAAALREAHENRAAGLARAATARDRANEAFAAAAFAQRIETASLDILLREPVPAFRLCIVSSWDVRCGVAEYTNALVGALLLEDELLEITLLADSRTPAPEAAESRVRVRPAWTLGAPDNAQTLRRATAAADPHLVLVQHQPSLMPWTALADVLAALSQGPTVVAVTLHNTAHLETIEEQERQLALASLANAARVIVHTAADLARLQRLGLQDNVVLIPQGAPQAELPSPERTLIARDTVTIGSCGFLLPGKGIPALVAAAGLLKPRWPKLQLLLVNALYGSPESQEEAQRMREALRAAGMETATEHVGDFLPIEESRWRLSTCDIICLPYEASREASSAALRMALSAGPPVAVSPIDLFNEADGVVWRLPGSTPTAIAEGLHHLLMDHDKRAALRQEAYAWMQVRNWNTVAGRTLGMLKGLFLRP